MYWEEIEVQGQNRLRDNFPKTKKEFIFGKEFVFHIERRAKSLSIRNSPVELGLYELKKGLIVEVFGVKKYNYSIKGYYVSLINEEDSTRDIGYENLGFDNAKTGRNYYENYLKHDFCYFIEFKVVANEN